MKFVYSIVVSSSNDQIQEAI